MPHQTVWMKLGQLADEGAVVAEGAIVAQLLDEVAHQVGVT